MKQAYLTPTLLNNWIYYINSAESYENQAKESFFNCLNKIKTEPTPEMLRGLEYEDKVYHLASGHQIESEDETIKEIAKIIKGGLFQVPLCKTLISYKGIEIFLYGICDALKQNTIYDIKRVSKYDIGKYLKSAQHKIYLVCSNADTFLYLISDGENVYKEEYFKSQKMHEDLKGSVYDFLSWLDTNNLLETYLELWIWAGKDKG